MARRRLLSLVAGTGQGILIDPKRIDYIVMDTTDEGTTVTIFLHRGYDPVVFKNAPHDTVVALLDLADNAR